MAGPVQQATRVANTQVPPYSAIGMLVMTWSDGGVAYGSGALIDPVTVLTCSHNLIDPVTDPPPRGQATAISFYPGYNQTRPQPQPPGGLPVVAAFYSQRFYQGQDAWDVGICRLANPYNLAPPGVYLRPRATGKELIGQTVALTGYPGPYRGQMFRDDDEIAGVELTTNTCIFTNDTWGGNSGSPIYTQDDDAEGVTQHAIHVSVSGAGDGLRRGVLITQPILDWITTTMAQPNPAAGFLVQQP